MENTHNFFIPKVNLIGVGAIKDLPTELMKYKLSKALIVTDKNIIKLGYVEMVETILKNLFITYDIFDGITHPDAEISFIEDGLSYFPKVLNVFKRKYDFIISIGGGTNHDCAKGIAVVAENGGSIADYEGYNKVTKPCLPVVTINTTAGSASEITMFSIIRDTSRNVKMTIGSPNMIPSISVSEPMFMATMPQEVTATSGIDIVSHAVEAYCSTEASPITDSLALGALKLVFKYLKRAYDNGHDLEAREQMMFANIKAGMAFNNAGLGYVHSISHQIGAFYKITHGICNAVLLPHVLEFNAKAVPEQRIIDIAEAIGEKATNKSEAVQKINCAFQELCNQVNIPIESAIMDINISDFETIAKNALKDITALTNPRKGNAEDIIGMLEKIRHVELAEV